MKNFLENIYGILIEPQATIDKIIETKPIWQAFSIITILSIASAILGHKEGFNGIYDILFFVGNIVIIFISSLIIWFTLAGFFEVTARIFSDECRFKEILSLMGFALLPWVLTAPLILLKINIPLTITATILEVLVWVWSLVLIFLSVKKVYNLTIQKTWLFFLMPILGTIVAINWISQFFAIFIELF